MRPEHLQLQPSGSALGAEVVVVEPTGAETLVVSRLGGGEVQAVFRERHKLTPGDKIGLAPDLNHVHLFDKASGQRLAA